MIFETNYVQETQLNDKVATVLVIDDEQSVRRFLHAALSVHGYAVYESATGQDGIFQVVNLQPDLILLDVDLPDMNGIEVTKTIREWCKTPILIVSVHDQDSDKIEALDAGADDYIVKPFSIGELMARMRAALRHVQPITEMTSFSCGDLLVDLTARLVKVKGQVISLTPTEYSLLQFLVTHAGKVITHQQLWHEIQPEEDGVDSHLIRVHMSNLRRKLEADPTNPQYILTEPGIGYRLCMDGA